MEFLLSCVIIFLKGIIGSFVIASFGAVFCLFGFLLGGLLLFVIGLVEIKKWKQE